MKIKKALILFTMSLMIGVSTVQVYAIAAEKIEVCNDNEEIAPCIEEIIEYKYRMYNGVLQYRRWNTTTGEWVDPYWINV